MVEKKKYAFWEFGVWLCEEKELEERIEKFVS